MSHQTVERGIDDMGPIDYLVVEFPGSRMTGAGLPLLASLADDPLPAGRQRGIPWRTTRSSPTTV